MTHNGSNNQDGTKTKGNRNQRNIQANFTQIPNKLLDDLMNEEVCPRLKLMEWRIMLFMIRVTFGWGRIYARVTRSECMRAIGLTDVRWFQRSLNSLLDKNILLKKTAKGKKGHGAPTYYAINEDSKKWVNRISDKEFSNLISTLDFDLPR